MFVVGFAKVTEFPRPNAGARPSPKSDGHRAAEPSIPAASGLAEPVDPPDARRAAQCALNIPPRARNPDALTSNVPFCTIERNSYFTRMRRRPMYSWQLFFDSH
jgi:hypothetical protein